MECLHGAREGLNHVLYGARECCRDDRESFHDAVVCFFCNKSVFMGPRSVFMVINNLFMVLESV